MRYGVRDFRSPQFLVGAYTNPGQPTRPGERITIASHDRPPERQLELVEPRFLRVLVAKPAKVERFHPLRTVGLHLVPIEIAAEIRAHHRALAVFEPPVRGKKAAGSPAVRVANVDMSAKRAAIEIDHAHVGGVQVAAKGALG